MCDGTKGHDQPVPAPEDEGRRQAAHQPSGEERTGNGGFQLEI